MVILSLFHHCMGQIINFFKVHWSLDWEKPHPELIETIMYHPETLDFKLNAVDLGLTLGGGVSGGVTDFFV